MLVYYQIFALFICYLPPGLNNLNITCDYLNKSKDAFSGSYILSDYSSISDLKFSCGFRDGLKPLLSVGFYYRSSKSMIFDATIDF